MVSSAPAHADVHHLPLQQFAWCLQTTFDQAHSSRQSSLLPCRHEKTAQKLASHMMHTVPTKFM